MEKSRCHLRKKCVVFALVFFIVFPILLGGYSIVYSQPSRPPEDMVIWEIIDSPDSLDPAVDNEDLGRWVLSNIYETLYTYPFNNSSTETIVPLLAAGLPSISPDGKNYTIELRQGISFHDSTPFNASCVKWNIERAMKIFAEWSIIVPLADALLGGSQVKETALSNGTDSLVFKLTFDDWITNSSAIEVIDVYTIRFALAEAFSPFVSILATLATAIMSPTFAIDHAFTLDLTTWEAYGVDYGDNETYMNAHTCGTGPYTITDWVPDQYIALRLYDGYWRSIDAVTEISPPAYAGAITRVFFRINDDGIGRKLNLRAGVVDGGNWPRADADEIWNSNEKIILDSNIHVSADGLEFGTTFFGFNMGNLTTTINSNIITIESPFSNKHFRRSASFAFNYSELIEGAYNNLGIQARGPIPMGMVGHNGSSFKFNYNVATAVEEWNLAMEDPELISSLNTINCSLTFYFIEESILNYQSVNLLQQGLERVFSHPLANLTGLNHNVTTMIDELPSQVYSQYRTQGRLPVTIYDWIPDYADPISYLNPLCYSEGFMAREIGYNNSEVDMWYELAISEINTLQRQIYFNHIQDTIADETPYLWLYQQLEFRTWRNWTLGDGLTFNPMRDIYFYHIFKDYPFYNPQYPVLEPIILVGMVILLPVYMMKSYYSSPIISNKRIKLILLTLYTGLALYMTFWTIIFLYIWVILFPIPSLIWVAWCFMYSDYKREDNSVKATKSTTDIE